MKYLYILILLLSIVLKSYSQCNEYGIVLEYRGVQKKTPLGGVELSIVGAQSTVSNTNGNFVLKFTTSKPGQAVRYNDIYKNGYVIFNTDAVGAWRISNDKRPFSIIMCKEDDFRKLKKKFYGIIEKSYKEDYLRQRALARKKNNDVLILEQELKRIEADYQKKLSNINSYVEIFSRIDRSEMDEGERRAIQYIEEGKIKEAIDEYEKLKILQHADEQINKLISSNEVIRAGERMQNETVDDLLSLCGKLQQQIGAYEMGGINYDSMRIVSIQKIISVYHQINAIGKYDYREDEGRWLVVLGNMEWKQKVMLQRFKTAADIPSYIGLTTYADFCYYHTPYAAHYAIDACESYKKAIVLARNYGMDQSIQDSLLVICRTLPDFCEPIENGDSLCFMIKDSINNVVNIVPRTNFAYNVLSEIVSIPKDIVHNGIVYKIDSIVGHALDNNRKLRKLIVQKELKGNIVGCENVDTIIVGDTAITPGKDTINFAHQIDVVKTDTIDFKARLQSYIDIAELVAREVKNRYLNATSWPDYEELVSIGILAIQVLIKNKTPKQLEKMNAIYMITAVNWAIKNEMKIRYNWFGKVYDNNESKTNRGSQDENILKANVRTTIYRNNYNYYKMLIDESYNLSISLNESIYRELSQGGTVIDSVINSMSKDDSVILKDMLTSNMQVEQILRKHHISLSKYNMILDVLEKNMLDTTFKDNSQSPPTEMGRKNENASKKDSILLSYIAIVKLAAQMVYDKIDKNLVDYEELMSIGILAINEVIGKKNILAQSVEYNNWYVLAVVEWAMLNELSIRYNITLLKKISKEDEVKLHRKNITQDEVRISVYQAVYMIKDIISNMDDTKLLNIKDLQEINNVISDYISQLSKSTDRKLLNEILGGANVVEVAKTNGLPLDKTYDKVIHFLDMLNYKLKAKGLTAY